MDIIISIFFIPVSFVFSILLAYTIRKRIIEKILFIDIDENLKDLTPKEFFYNILKIEKSAKPFYYVEFFFSLLLPIIIVIQGYKEYLKRLEIVKDYPDFPISTILFILPKLAILIIIWFIVTFLLILAIIMRKLENKRISEMLNNLEKHNLLKYAKEDFINSDRIVETRMIGQSDIKLGNKYFFSIYPAHIIPYSWIDDVKVGVIFGRYGSKTHYLDFRLKESFKSIKIIFSKKEIAEKIIKYILKNK